MAESTAYGQSSVGSLSPASLLRWSGRLLVPSGILLVFYFVFRAVGPYPPSAGDVLANPGYKLERSLGVAAFVLAQLGLIGLSAFLAERGRALTLIGFLLAFMGNALVLPLLFYQAYALPILASTAPQMLDPATTPVLNDPLTLIQSLIPWLLFGIGFVLLGVVALRGGGSMRWAGILLIVGGVLLGLPILEPWSVVDLGGVLLGIGQAWFGLIMWPTERAMPIW